MRSGAACRPSRYWLCFALLPFPRSGQRVTHLASIHGFEESRVFSAPSGAGFAQSSSAALARQLSTVREPSAVSYASFEKSRLARVQEKISMSRRFAMAWTASWRSRPSASNRARARRTAGGSLVASSAHSPARPVSPASLHRCRRLSCRPPPCRGRDGKRHPSRRDSMCRARNRQRRIRRAPFRVRERSRHCRARTAPPGLDSDKSVLRRRAVPVPSRMLARGLPLSAAPRAASFVWPL